MIRSTLFAKGQRVLTYLVFDIEEVYAMMELRSRG